MDKNLISIDDLVRQKLSGSEEDERPGGWLQMRDLLDQKMPVNARALFNWRRMMSYTALLLLLASVSLGGYEMISASRGHSDVEGSVASAIHTKMNLGSRTSGSGNSYTTPTSKTHNIAINTQSNNQTPTNIDEITHTPQPSNISSAANNHLESAQRTNSSRLASYPAAVSSTGKTETESVKPVSHVIKTRSSGKKMLASNVMHPGKLKTSHSNKGTVIALSSKIQSFEKNNSKMPVLASGANTTIAKNKASAITPAKGLMVINANGKQKNLTGRNSINTKNISSVYTSSVPLQESEKQSFKLKNETIEKIEIVQRYIKDPSDRTGHYYSDTIAMNDITITQRVKNENQPSGGAMTLNTNKEAQILPASAPVTESIDGKAKNGATNNNVAGTTAFPDKIITHKKTNNWDIGKFQDLLRNFRYSLGRVPFTTGFIGGINGTFFAPAIVDGFQFGLSGNFQFDDHWSLATELKYIQRINNGSTINDSYTTDIPDVFGNPVRTLIKTSYNYSLLQSITAPLIFKYRIDRHYSMFVGGNLVYNFAINESAYNVHIKDLTSAYSAPNLDPRTSFDGRIGIGYILGLTYQVSPALNFDFRVCQTLADNAQTSGAKIISNDLYKSPSFQISLGYRLSRDKRVP